MSSIRQRTCGRILVLVLLINSPNLVVPALAASHHDALQPDTSGRHREPVKMHVIFENDPRQDLDTDQSFVRLRSIHTDNPESIELVDSETNQVVNNFNEPRYERIHYTKENTSHAENEFMSSDKNDKEAHQVVSAEDIVEKTAPSVHKNVYFSSEHSSSDDHENLIQLHDKNVDKNVEYSTDDTYED